MQYPVHRLVTICVIHLESNLGGSTDLLHPGQTLFFLLILATPTVTREWITILTKTKSSRVK